MSETKIKYSPWYLVGAVLTIPATQLMTSPIQMPSQEVRKEPASIIRQIPKDALMVVNSIDENGCGAFLNKAQWEASKGSRDEAVRFIQAARRNCKEQ